MSKHFLTITLFLSSFVFSACEFSGDGTITVLPLEEQGTIEQNLYSDWTAVNNSKSAHLKVFEVRDKDGVLKERINVLSLNKNKFIFEIQENVVNPLSVNAWHFENQNALAVINGSFFDENYKATGGLWLKGKGKIISLTGNNSYDGAVTIDSNGKLSLQYLPSNNLQTLKDDEQILVNFPMLISKGKMLLKNNGGEGARRSLIGEDEQFIYLISTDSFYFNLYDMMVWAGQNLEGLENLMNLDGGSSGGLSVLGDLVKWSNNSLASVPNVIIAYEQK
ncbi:MAG TPA: phosphodiester glycosidase family protein [bacterium]|nr:phosphodiester glycosidase family protein [bacterium]